VSVAIVDLAYGNIGSIEIALKRLGAETLRTADPSAIRAAERVVLPGVGAAGYAMGRIDALGLRDTLTTLEQPLLGICLGMQLLFEESEEDNAACLGLIPGTVQRFRLEGRVQGDGSRYKVPQMGWNRVRQEFAHPLWAGIPDESWFYFVHSFHAAPSEARHSAGTTEYGDRFTSAVARDNIFATQFHPEKSADLGLALYRNFLHWMP